MFQQIGLLSRIPRMRWTLALVGLQLCMAAIGSATTFQFTQTENVTSSSDLNAAPMVFDNFASIGAPSGSTLIGTTIEMAISETLTAVYFEASRVAGGPGTVTANVSFGGGDTASGTDATSLNAAIGAGGSYRLFSESVCVGTGAGCIPVSSLDTFSSYLPTVYSLNTGAITVSTLTPYRSTGTFSLTASTNTSSAVTGVPGFMSGNPAVAVAATSTVVYTYQVTAPEPDTGVSLAILAFGIGLWAVSLRRRRGMARTGL